MDKKLNNTDVPGTTEEPVTLENTTPETTETAPVSPEPNSEITEILTRFLPDADVSTPEAIINSSLQLLKSFVPLHDKLYDLAKTNPESAATLSDWLDTGNLIKAIARNFGEEEKQALMEELADESYEEDRAMYSEKSKKRKDREKLLSDNISKSQISAQEFVDEIGATEEQIEEFKPFVDQFITDCEDRNLTKANWIIIWKAFKHDANVEEAETNGRIMGRNEKIVAEKKTREDIKDLLPEVSASADIKPKSEKQKSFASQFMEGVL